VIAGLVLAAGDGTRFHADRSKLVAELRGRPLLEHALRAPCAVRALERVVVVLGARAQEIAAAVDFGRAEVVVCDDWAAGQAASLKRGVAALPGAERVIVTLGDQPGVTPALIERFLDAPPGSRAVYDGRPGHPVVLGPEHLAAVTGLTGDAGARSLLRGGAEIECSDLGRGLDVDTLDDLEAIRHEARAVV
jgi:CTP:molybdopterin cytidylyltransferase MocA